MVLLKFSVGCDHLRFTRFRKTAILQNEPRISGHPYLDLNIYLPCINFVFFIFPYQLISSSIAEGKVPAKVSGNTEV